MSERTHDVPEEGRIPFRWLLAGSAAVLLVFALAVWWVVVILRDEAHALIPAGPAPPARVGAEEIGLVEQRMFQPEGRGERLRREQLRRLSSYGWVDRDAGIIHIPVARAMEEVAAP